MAIASNCGYGAGAAKVQTMLQISGVDTTLQTSTKLVKGYRQLYKGVFHFGNKLKEDCIQNGGFILNAFQRPLAVARSKQHDILNTFIQSSGHDALMWWVHFTVLKLKADPELWANVQPLMPDQHDDTVWLIREGYEESFIKLQREALDEMNAQLGWDIPILAEPELATNVAAYKCEDYDEDYHAGPIVTTVDPDTLKWEE